MATFSSEWDVVHGVQGGKQEQPCLGSSTPGAHQRYVSHPNLTSCSDLHPSPTVFICRFESLSDVFAAQDKQIAQSIFCKGDQALISGSRLLKTVLAYPVIVKQYFALNLNLISQIT